MIFNFAMLFLWKLQASTRGILLWVNKNINSELDTVDFSVDKCVAYTFGRALFYAFLDFSVTMQFKYEIVLWNKRGNPKIYSETSLWVYRVTAEVTPTRVKILYERNLPWIQQWYLISIPKIFIRRATVTIISLFMSQRDIWQNSNKL